MSMSGIFARVVAVIGAGAVLWRRQLQGAPRVQALGSNPTIPTARPQGSIPTLKMPTARGWTIGIPARGVSSSSTVVYP
jgi:hypothetical protein